MTDLRIALSPAAEAGAPVEPTVPRPVVRFVGDAASVVEGGVIGEIRFTIFVNGSELVTLMCSPWKLQSLVLGFLFLEGFISGLDDVELLRICVEDRLAEVTLRGELPPATERRRILTSGCSGGTSFGAYLDAIDDCRLDSDLQVPPAHLYSMMRALYERASLYRRVRGCHSSMLADARGPLVVAEDIGRHNTLDKILGSCLLEGIAPAGRILLSSGRISSEMLLKCAAMGIPIVGSRTSPTGLAVLLGERLNLTVVGYIRQDTMNVYTHPWRIVA